MEPRGYGIIIRRFMIYPISYMGKYFRKSTPKPGIAVDRISTGHIVFPRRNLIET
ncbi:MAG: hypothetical protein M1431_04655 [Candidatus Thermoplasmatota archaeon]|nr:hypothetical protein [Candidatus Thermoplasmatota archaeon]